jgi:hypothetical protein
MSILTPDVRRNACLLGQPVLITAGRGSGQVGVVSEGTNGYWVVSIDEQKVFRKRASDLQRLHPLHSDDSVGTQANCNHPSSGAIEDAAELLMACIDTATVSETSESVPAQSPPDTGPANCQSLQSVQPFYAYGQSSSWCFASQSAIYLANLQLAAQQLAMQMAQQAYYSL